MSLRFLFVATSYLAVVCAALAFPSVAWVVGFALANICMATYAAQRAALSPDARRFWLGYLAGVGAYFAALKCIQADVVNSVLVGPLWNQIHNPVSFSPFSPDGSALYVRFRDTATLAIMIAVPLAVAYAMTFLSRKRDSS
jgi:hypothetical protein